MGNSLISLIPDPLDSDRQYERFCHYDLVGMEIKDLLDELHSIRSQLWFLKSDRFARRVGLFEQGRRIKWLRERVLKIETELRKRRYAIQETRSQPSKRRMKILRKGISPILYLKARLCG